MVGDGALDIHLAEFFYHQALSLNLGYNMDFN
jgi:hypothetical protein